MRSLLIVIAVLSLPAVAFADGRVSVRLTDSAGRPIDAQVTLSGQGVTRGCRTVGSRCTISVPAGSYTASIRPTREGAPPARRISVQEGRTVTLSARTQATRTANTALRAQPAGTVRARPATVRPTTSGRPATVRTTSVRTTGSRPMVVGARPSARATTVRATPQVQRTPTVYRGGTRTNTRVQPRATASRPQPQVTGTRRTATTASPFVTASPGAARPSARATATAGPTQTAGTVRARNLASGARLCVQGQVMDGAGRPADATLTVSQGGRVVGSVRSVAGRFSMFDLAPGGYQMTVQSARGGSSNASLNVSGGTSRIVVRVP